MSKLPNFSLQRGTAPWYRLIPRKLMPRDFGGSKSHNNEKAFKAGNQTFELCQNHFWNYFRFLSLSRSRISDQNKFHCIPGSIIAIYLNKRSVKISYTKQLMYSIDRCSHYFFLKIMNKALIISFSHFNLILFEHDIVTLNFLIMISLFKFES